MIPGSAWHKRNEAALAMRERDREFAAFAAGVDAYVEAFDSSIGFLAHEEMFRMYQTWVNDGRPT